MTEPQVDRLLLLGLDEDLPAGDVTTEAIISPSAQGVGRFVARRPTVLAGTDVAARVFALVDSELEVTFARGDGSALADGEAFGEVRGSLRSLLRGERLALNLMQRLSGVATTTRAFVDKVAGTGVTIVDTRKTTPGVRLLEKRAVLAGGGKNHRGSLSDGVLIKTNHIRCAGSVGAAVSRARSRTPHTLRIEVEVRNIDELEQAIESGADIAMLDNMSVAEMTRAVEFARGRVVLEASGGVVLESVSAVAHTGVDLVSVGALTHSATSADLAFEVEAMV